MQNIWGQCFRTISALAIMAHASYEQDSAYHQQSWWYDEPLEGGIVAGKSLKGLVTTFLITTFW